MFTNQLLVFLPLAAAAHKWMPTLNANELILGALLRYGTGCKAMLSRLTTCSNQHLHRVVVC
ncbi:hypothetical protein B1A85_12670 [Chroococcidiopsis sp. TS-821]|nr:hypothetical protein B1A85_12670 [Chroococcidiopsis sp. TS-821]